MLEMSIPHLKSEKNYRKIDKEIEMILDYIPGLIFYKDKKNNFIRVNKYVADAHKETKEAMEGKSLFEFYPKDQAQAYWDDDLEVINSGIPKLNIEEPWETKEGTRWRRTNKIPYVDDNGKVIGIIGFSIDITERKNAEQKLRKSQEQLDTIFTTLKDAIFVISDNYKILFSNEPAHNLFGEDIIGKDCYEIMKGLYQPCEYCPMKKCAERDECMVHFEQCVSTPVIECTKYFDIIATKIENYDGSSALIEVLRDITKQKKVETEIRRLGAYNRNLIEISLDPFITIDQEGKIMDVNRATEMITGRSREELIGTKFSSYFTESEKAFEGYKKVFEIGSVQDYELEIQHVDEHVTPVLFNASVFKDENGNVSGVFAVARDISKHIAIERKLRESEKNLNKLNLELEDKIQERTRNLQKEIEKSQMYLNIVGVLITVINTDETIALVNKRCSKILSFNEKELIGKNWFDNFVPNRIRVEIKSAFKKVLAGEVEPVEHCEYPILTKNGEERLIAWHIVILRDNHGINIGVLYSGEDITEQKKLEQKLIESEVKYRELFEDAPNAYFSISPDQIIIRCNKAAEKLLGYSMEEISRIKVFDLYYNSENGLSKAETLFQRLLNGDKIQDEELQMRHKNGNPIWVSLTVKPVMNEKGQVVESRSMVIDITKRKRAEEERIKAQTYLKYSLSSSIDGILLLDKDTRYIFVNPTFLNWIGRKAEDFIGKTTLEASPYMTPETTKIIVERIKERVETGEAIIDKEVEFIDKDGKFMPVSYSATGIRDDMGNIIGEIVSIRDITQRKRNEQKIQRTLEKLKESEEKYRLITENANDLIAVLNSKFEHEYINENTYQRILGYNNKDLLGKTRHDIIHPDDYNTALEILKDGFKEGKGRGELRIRHKNGKYIWVETIGKVFKDSENNLKAITISRDITEHKKNEQKLKIMVEDLTRSNVELEQFAYIASHDLQEPLRMVASFTQLLQRRYQDKLDKEANDFINFAVEGATRMQALINDLLLFSRVGTRGKPFYATDMNIVFESVKIDLSTLITESNAEVTSDPLPVIIADDIQMIQLLQNLISNAIKFNNSEIPMVHITGEVKENSWEFSVKDNGIGIESQYFDRIFIIFQRLHKKDEYKGTGIGLAVCKKIVQRHGGKIWVESEIGKGSAFYFSIPKKKSKSINKNNKKRI